MISKLKRKHLIVWFIYFIFYFVSSFYFLNKVSLSYSVEFYDLQFNSMSNSEIEYLQDDLRQDIFSFNLLNDSLDIVEKKLFLSKANDKFYLVSKIQYKPKFFLNFIDTQANKKINSQYLDVITNSLKKNKIDFSQNYELLSVYYFDDMLRAFLELTIISIIFAALGLILTTKSSLRVKLK